MTYPAASQPSNYYSPQRTAPTPPPPASHWGWAIAAVVFFWPLAFAAANHAGNVFPLWARGDYAGAQYASDRAKALGKWSLGLFFIAVVVTVASYIVLIAVIISSASSSYS